jgi:hypothetical protein
VTIIVGDGVDDADAALVDSTRRALDAGIAAPPCPAVVSVTSRRQSVTSPLKPDIA